MTVISTPRPGSWVEALLGLTENGWEILSLKEGNMINKLKMAQTTVDKANSRFPQMNMTLIVTADGIKIAGADYSRLEVYDRVVAWDVIDQGFEDLLRLEVEKVVEHLGSRQ